MGLDRTDKEVVTYKYSGKKLVKSVLTYVHTKKDDKDTDNYSYVTTSEYFKFNKKGDPTKKTEVTVRTNSKGRALG